MKRKTTLVLIIVIFINVVIFVGVRHWRMQKQEQARIMLRDATRYAGTTGGIVAAFDERTDRWIGELKTEKIEETLSKLTDAAEYMAGIMSSDGIKMFHDEEWRERSFYKVVTEAILSNRRFRKAYEDLQKTNKKKSAELLSKHIRENLTVLRTMLQEDVNRVSRDTHKESDRIVAVLQSTTADDAYRPMSIPGTPPTRTGRKYGVFSYLLLASLLEIREVRPAVEEVIEFARKEYELFNCVNDSEAFIFKVDLLDQSLYNPSLLVTAAFCDPSWKVTEKKRLPQEKLFEREVVDYQARAIEHDDLAGKGLVPVVPHEGMLKIRYYQGITDEEFNEFFGK